MKQVRLAKAARYPLGSTVVHRSGEVIDVEDKDFDALVELGVVATEPTGPSDSETVEDSEEPGEPEAPSAPSTTGYPALPKKTAPVAEWKEYARRNGIKLTGLTKRNEIMGFVTKTVNQSR
ncbi:hypothetical protein [Corynebacterium marquesiae]|uniref:hypothetical protein n=1 Tax=Corynebacterium marquesiae TaxID=2913503 RepID=UPI0038CFE9E2